jgi:hypothetical protein
MSRFIRGRSALVIGLLGLNGIALILRTLLLG